MYQIKINDKTTLKPALNADDVIYWQARLTKLSGLKERVEIVKAVKGSYTNYHIIV